MKGGLTMFKYVFRPSDKSLVVNLPDTLKFNFIFLQSIAELMYRIANTPCDTIYFRCGSVKLYATLSKAYLYNIFEQISKRKKVFWSRVLRSTILTSVHSQQGADFTPISDFGEAVFSQELNLYYFTGDVNIQAPITEISKLIVENNLAINPADIKEFLSTTIGEIFSNSIIHSDQELTYFMYDIVYENQVFWLYVNIIDYGKTIIENVQSFLSRTHHTMMKGSDCLEWAIAYGNTTRDCSGGYGLPTLIQYIQNVNGELCIFSGNTYYHLENRKTIIQETPNSCFYGTSVTFKIELLKTSDAIQYVASAHTISSVSLENI